MDGKTPYEILFKAKLSYEHIRTFGCLRYVHNNQKPKDKFGDRSWKCVFIGYPFRKKGWGVYDLENGNIFTSLDVVFCEEDFPFSEKPMLPDNLGRNLAPSPPMYDYEAGSMPFFKSTPDNAIGPTAEDGPTPSTAISRGGQGVDGPIAEDGLMPGPETLPCNRPAAVGGPSSPSPGSPLPDPSDHFGPHEPARNEPAAQPNESAKPDHNKRPGQAPSYLEDYNCYNASLKDPSTRALTLQKVSSSKPCPIANYVACDKFSPPYKCYLSAITKIVELKFYHEAAKDKNWRDAMAQEIEALELNNTWAIMDLLPCHKPINCKWVYRAKYNADVSLEKYKAYVVIRGDKQVERFDFTETFASVAKMSSVRCFLVVAAARSGNSIKWMSTMHFCMVICMKRFT